MMAMEEEFGPEEEKSDTIDDQYETEEPPDGGDGECCDFPDAGCEACKEGISIYKFCF